ncbi:8231_t:CDS:2 [Ambispora gerdemannii]|uniref:8231_t:CDS:1 n=1 Tax=Ambispora gerdemannii TaxID=144530 RepID=A0A9N9AN06_9GLOM|nr:8231_t:CDS:2 [Ambispora gerdemannii]
MAELFTFISPPKRSNPIDELLDVFNNANNRWEHDKKIVERVEFWLSINNLNPKEIFDTVYSQAQINIKYASILAFLYDYGIGTEIDRKQTFHWYEVAASNLDDPLAQNQIGYCYNHGIGIEKNYKAATKWLQKSALNGFPGGEHLLANRLFNGKGILNDYEAAFKWNKKAAISRYMLAELSIGNCYYYGIGVAKDFHKSVNWYRRSAFKGNGTAQVKLGNCHSYAMQLELEVRLVI